MHYTRYFLVSVLLVLSVCGCGENVPLKGKVTFSDDGSPLTRGTVIFVKENFQSRGVIQPDGTFNVTSVNPGDGLPPGTYKIGIVDAVDTDVIPLIDPKHTSPDNSGLTLTVDSSTKSYDIKVDRYTGKVERPLIGGAD